MTQTETSPDPWERQPDETDQSWEAFRIYRDLGATRSLVKVANELGKSRQLIERWSRTHKFVARAAAWDVEEDRLWRMELMQQRRQMAKRQAQTAAVMQNKLTDWIKAVDTRVLTANEARAWFDTATKVERDVLGTPQVIELQNGGMVGSQTPFANLTAEEAMQRLADVQREIHELLDGSSPD